MKIMISQPMNGRSDKEIRAEREKIVQKFNELDIKVVNTLFEEEPPMDIKNIGVWYLAKSIRALSDVNALYMCKGWEISRGCQIERKIAKQYGIKILETNFIDEETVTGNIKEE